MLEQTKAEATVQNGSTPCAGMAPLTALSMRSDKVTIGPLLPDDTGSIFLWLNDVESVILDLTYRPVDWMKYNNWLEHFSQSEAQIIFAIRTIQQPKIIGFIAITKIDSVHRSAEIGIRIGAPSDRGKGYGKDAIKLALNYAWAHLNLHRVHLRVFESNRHAISAYRAAGFQHEGKLRQAAFVNGEWTDVVLMGILRPERT
jgi:RimJ/RimL family protein N-acetyltransferase